jgi:heme/copper-type cytochrome/quinol oxidase subunit 2
MNNTRVQFAIRIVPYFYRALPTSTRLLGLVIVILLAGCDGAQSSLEPAGRSAEKIADLFWLMTVGAAIIWTVVVGLTFYSVRIAPGRRSPRFTCQVLACYRRRIYALWQPIWTR